MFAQTATAAAASSSTAAAEQGVELGRQFLEDLIEIRRTLIPTAAVTTAAPGILAVVSWFIPGHVLTPSKTRSII
jgi:fatty acid desaturase